MVSSELLLQVGLLNRVIVLTFDSFVAHICVYRIFSILSKLIHEQKIVLICFIVSDVEMLQLFWN